MTRPRIFAATKMLLLAAILATTGFHQHVAKWMLVFEERSASSR